MSGNNVLFGHPFAILFTILLIPLMIGFIYLMRYRKRQVQTYSTPETLPHLIIPRAPILTFTKGAGWAAIWVLCCLALMNPIGNIRYSSSSEKSSAASSLPHYIPHEVLLLVDASASMGVPDGPDGETRLDEAKTLMTDLISQLKGQMVSLYAFTSQLSALVPPTVDYLFVRFMIKDLHIDEGDVGGTAFASTLEALKQKAFPKPLQKRLSVILLSDGGDNQLDNLKGSEREQEIQRILQAIPDPETLHLRLYAIGLGGGEPKQIPHVTNEEGKPVYSALEPEILQKLAEKERGKYYTAKEWASWSLAEEIILQMGEDPLVGEQAGAMIGRQISSIKAGDYLYDLYYQIPLGIALLFYFINLFLPDVRR